MLFQPKILTTLRNYTRKQFFADLLSGIIVGIVALPLAIAFAIASGVSPEKGLFTAIVAGFIISALGGSRVQIGGPTGAFVVIVYGIVNHYGVGGLTIATLLAGIMLVFMGIVKLGSIIKYIPHPLIVGFTAGIALIIFSSQVKDFLGLQMGSVPADFIQKCTAYFQHAGSVNWWAFLIAAGTTVLAFVFPKISTKIPGSLIAIVLATFAVQFFHLDVETIGKKFGDIPSMLPAPRLPVLSFSTIQELIQPAFTIALLGGIESLLSAVVADGMIGASHRSNTELIAQGIANIASSLFGGIPATGAIARTATNVKNGGRTPVAGMVHAVTLLLIMLFVGRWAKLIPMPCLAGILVVVAFNMSEYKSFIALLKGPKSDALILITTFLLTVLVDLTAAIEIGMVLAAFLFMRNMMAISKVSLISIHDEDLNEDKDEKAISRYTVPKGIEVFEITGPMFFGAAYKFKESIYSIKNPPKILIIRMRAVPVIDATGLHTIDEVFKFVNRFKTQVIASGVQPQVFEALKESGLLDKIGEKNVVQDIDAALARARELLNA
ncbi:MAG: SulP family inorganic anion transporter [Bacteroidia bacterium]